MLHIIRTRAKLIFGCFLGLVVVERPCLREARPCNCV